MCPSVSQFSYLFIYLFLLCSLITPGITSPPCISFLLFLFVFRLSLLRFFRSLMSYCINVLLSLCVLKNPSRLAFHAHILFLLRIFLSLRFGLAKERESRKLLRRCSTTLNIIITSLNAHVIFQIFKNSCASGNNSSTTVVSSSLDLASRFLLWTEKWREKKQYTALQ